MTNWMTAAGIALIAGGLAILIGFRHVLWGRGTDRPVGERRRNRRAVEAAPVRPALTAAPAAAPAQTVAQAKPIASAQALTVAAGSAHAPAEDGPDPAAVPGQRGGRRLRRAAPPPPLSPPPPPPPPPLSSSPLSSSSSPPLSSSSPPLSSSPLSSPLVGVTPEPVEPEFEAEIEAEIAAGVVAEGELDPGGAVDIDLGEIEPVGGLARIGLAAEEDDEDDELPAAGGRDGDRISGWIRPEPADEPASGEYWTPVSVSPYADAAYGWPVPVERLPAAPPYPPQSGFDTEVESEPTAVVPTWPPKRPSDRDAPRSWAARNTKDRSDRSPLDRENTARQNQAPNDRALGDGMLADRALADGMLADRALDDGMLADRALENRARDVRAWDLRNRDTQDNRFREGGRAAAEADRFADDARSRQDRRSTVMIPAVDDQDTAPRRRPRPRPGPDDDRSTVYRSRHAADPG